MIQIQQDMPSTHNLDMILNKFGETEMTIDIASIKSDIETLRQKQLKTMSKTDSKNIKNVIEYLNKLLSRVIDNKLEIIWSLQGYKLKTYPIELLHIPEYGIDMSDYISAEDGKLIRVDFNDVLKVIVIEMMYRDLDKTMETMEETIEHLGITGIHSASDLIEHFDEDVINLSKILRIGDSPYATLDNKISFDYFGVKQFKSNFYRDSVGHSINHALTILTQAILDKLISNSIEFSLCSVTTSGVYFIVQKYNVDIYKILDEYADVRAFGRRFKVKSKVTVF